jgi:ParB-like chromosome segregation protein Spo0J
MKQKTAEWPLKSLKDHPRQREQFRDLGATDIDAFVADIQANGLKHPIEILPDGTILAGHQRVRAARALGWTTIRAVVRKDLANDAAAAEMFFISDNLNRRQLSLLDKVRCIRRAVRVGTTIAPSATRAGCGKSTLAPALRRTRRQVSKYGGGPIVSTSSAA